MELLISECKSYNYYQDYCRKRSASVIVIKTASYKMQKEAAIMQSLSNAIKKYGPKLVATALIGLGVAATTLVNQAMNAPYDLKGKGLLQWDPMDSLKPEERKNYDAIMAKLKPLAEEIKSQK
jgi:enolase